MYKKSVLITKLVVQTAYEGIEDSKCMVCNNNNRYDGLNRSAQIRAISTGEAVSREGSSI